jgi:ERCC4-type nuclease
MTTSSELPLAKSVLVLADDREAASSVPEALRQIPGVELQIQRLRVGDYEIEHSCVFERKTLTDFAASLIDGRLFVQAHRLASLPIAAAFILEGRASQLREVRVQRDALQGAMITLSLIFHLPVLRSLDASETARLMVYSGQQLQRQESFMSLRYKRRPKNRRRVQLHILQGLPGVGPQRARQLLERFGSVQAVMDASPEALAQAGNVGPKTALGIRDALRESPHTYGNPPSPGAYL